ncbi:MAG: hypothetical protein ACRDZU_00730 [Acidimicrobiales bacterium]
MTEPLADRGPTSFVASLGVRGRRRAEPRVSIAIAGGGCALAIVGVLIVAGDTGASDGGFNRVPGIILSALVVAAGFFALAGAERGAIATAGTVAAALGVPPLLFFLTFDDGGLPPYSTEGILFVSTIVWIGSYAIGPGRGRPFFLGAGLLGLWASALQLTEKVFDAPYLLFGFFLPFVAVEPGVDTFDSSGDIAVGGFGDEFNGDFLHVPDPTTIGILSLGFGVAYLLLGRRLDGQGHHGVATPFAFAAIPALLVGAIAMGDDLEQAGTGLLLIAIGLGLAHHGASVWRRATAWIGGATTAFGAAIFLGDMSDDATLVGLLFLAAGIGIVFAGHAIASIIDEPDELELTAAAVGATDDSIWAPPPPDDIPPPPQP